MEQNEPKTAGEEALLTFVRWVASLEDDLITRRRIGLQDIIDRAKTAKRFYDPPSKRQQLEERIKSVIPIIEDEDGAPLPDVLQTAIKSVVADHIIDEFQTEFYMLLDEDQEEDGSI